jgi:nitrate/TMAO reductase-like tetraheme cytochrome c subunit
MKNVWKWCREHLILVTLASVILVASFAFINIEILHMTSEPEFCALCHPKHGVGPLAEVDSWEHSAHSDAGVSCLDCHGRPGPLGYVKAKMGGLVDLYMQFTISKEHKIEILSEPSEDLVPDEHCTFCHTDEGNKEYREKHPVPLEIIEMRLLDHVENPEFRERKGLPDIMTDNYVGGTHFEHSFHIESFELACRDCHFGVVHNPKSKTDRMNVCVECHLDNEGSSAPLIADCKTCHEAQVAMNEGTGAHGVVGEPGLMYAADISCEMCHTQVSEGKYRSSSSGCVDCHDEDYKEIFTDWAAQAKNQIARLNLIRAESEEALLAAEKRHRDVTAGWKTYKRALANLNFVKDDGTNGVHNTDYAMAVLARVERDFKDIRKQLNKKW